MQSTDELTIAHLRMQLYSIHSYLEKARRLIHEADMHIRELPFLMCNIDDRFSTIQQISWPENYKTISKADYNKYKKIEELFEKLTKLVL